MAPPSRNNDKLRRREDILRAARMVFAQKGYHSAKVEDIADAAKVAKGTVYLYFPDKRSIIQELLDRVFVLLGGAILRVDTDSDIDAQVRHNIRAIIGLFMDEPTLIRLLLSPLNGVDPEFQKQMHRFFSTVRMLLARALADGQALGIVAAGDPALFATFSLGALKEALIDSTSGATGVAHTREEIVEGIYQMLSSGYLRTKPSTAPPRRAGTDRAVIRKG